MCYQKNYEACFKNRILHCQSKNALFEKAKAHLWRYTRSCIYEPARYRGAQKAKHIVAARITAVQHHQIVDVVLQQMLHQNSARKIYCWGRLRYTSL